jgi:hypothetical protein
MFIHFISIVLTLYICHTSSTRGTLLIFKRQSLHHIKLSRKFLVSLLIFFKRQSEGPYCHFLETFRPAMAQDKEKHLLKFLLD